MAVSQKLGDLYVAFKSTGKEELQADIKATTEAMKKSAADIRSAGLVIAGSIGGVTAGILAWARAGFQGTSAGEALSLRFQMLSREIANLFLPALIKLVEWLDRVIGWFHKLSGAAQTAIGVTVLVTAALVGLAVALPFVAAGFKALAAGITAALSATGIGALLPLIGAILVVIAPLVGALIGLFSTTQAGQRAFAVFEASLAKMFNAFRPALAQIAELVDRLMPIFEVLGSIVADVFVAALKGAVVVIEQMVAFAMPFLNAANALLGALGFRTGNTGSGQGRNQIQKAGGSFEDVRETYRRLQSTATRTSLAERANRLLEEIRNNTARGGFGANVPLPQLPHAPGAVPGAANWNLLGGLFDILRLAR